MVPRDSLTRVIVAPGITPPWASLTVAGDGAGGGLRKCGSTDAKQKHCDDRNAAGLAAFREYEHDALPETKFDWELANTERCEGITIARSLTEFVRITRTGLAT